MGETYAVLIGIEHYQQQGINSVAFAEADVLAVKDVLVEKFNVPADNITVWLDHQATKSVFENDLPYMIRQLSPGDRFILFFAGHGFFSNGTNRLATGILTRQIYTRPRSRWKRSFLGLLSSSQPCQI